MLLQLEEHRDLGTQDIGIEGLGQLVHGPGPVPLEDPAGRLAGTAQEDDRVPGGRRLTIDQDDREVLYRQSLRGVLAATRADDLASERRQGRRGGRQVLQPVVHDEHLGPRTWAQTPVTHIAHRSGNSLSADRC